MITIIILSAILVICSALMLLIILMQRPKQEGLGASFGGGMTQDLFGAQTTNVLQKSTTYLAVIFFVISMILAVLFNRQAEAAKSVEGLGLDGAPPAVEEQAAPAAEESAPTEETVPGEGVEPVTEPAEDAPADAEVSAESGAVTGALLGAAAGGIIGEPQTTEETESTEETEETPAGQ